MEDRELSERVQMGMRNFGFEPGPLSDYEHCIKDFHDRIRAVVPGDDAAGGAGRGHAARAKDGEMRDAARVN